MFAGQLSNALEEAESSYHKPMGSGGPPTWDGAYDPPPPNAGVNASVEDDLGQAALEASLYFSLGKMAPGGELAIHRSRFQVAAEPTIREGRMFLTLTDLRNPTGDGYTLVVPSDANFLPKLVKMGSTQGVTRDIKVVKTEEIEILSERGMPPGLGSAGSSNRAAMLHMLKKKKEKEQEKEMKGRGSKKGKKAKKEEDLDDDVLSERGMPPGLGSAGASNRAALLSILRGKKAKEDEKKKGKGKKGKNEEVDEISERGMPPGLGSAGASGRAAMLSMLRAKKAKEDEKKKKKSKGKGK